jgi:uncharacterized protein
LQYTTYGKTTERVSLLGMGGMRWSKEISDEQAVAALRRANELGVNYFDTAPGYCDDRSETILGKALAEMPNDDWFVATKGPNSLTESEVRSKIENSLRKLGVDAIDFYFLWCIITPEQYTKALEPGMCFDGIRKAHEEGLVRHVGISSHMESAGLKRIVDDGFFEFLMVPYNAVNFGQREDGVRYAKQKGLGVAAMNPLHGGIIAQYKDSLSIFRGSTKNGVEEGIRFCIESPYIDVTLSGMNSIAQVEENVGYANAYKPLDAEAFDDRVAKLRSSFDAMCTSCAYCVPGCPENIYIPAYMEVYNHYLLTGSIEETKGRLNWHKQFGLLRGKQPTASSCIECGACEETCTQYLDIITRLKWLDEHIESQMKEGA